VPGPRGGERRRLSTSTFLSGAGAARGRFRISECAMSYTVSLENFEGPLDLLLFLVRKNEIEIQDIPIVTITEQYLAYVDLMKALNLDVAGEFLVMAATLIYLKSRSLLPKCDEEEPEDEQTTLDALKRQLLEYEQYKDAALHLKEQNILEKNVFVRACYNDPVPDGDEPVLREISIFELLTALQKVIERSEEPDGSFTVTRDYMSVRDKISEVIEMVQTCPGGLAFEKLFGQSPQRIEVITTFLALLELIKMQAIRIFQNECFQSIYLFPILDEGERTHAAAPVDQQEDLGTNDQ
jgi:segregation and condensation protein A